MGRTNGLAWPDKLPLLSRDQREWGFRWPRPPQQQPLTRELLSATKTCDDAGAVYLDVQPVGVEVGCVGAPWLDLLSLASPGCPAGPLGQLRRVGLPDNSLGLACCTGLPLRSRLGEPFGRDQGESGQQAPK